MIELLKSLTEIDFNSKKSLKLYLILLFGYIIFLHVKIEINNNKYDELIKNEQYKLFSMQKEYNSILSSYEHKMSDFKYYSNQLFHILNSNQKKMSELENEINSKYIDSLAVVNEELKEASRNIATQADYTIERMNKLYEDDFPAVEISNLIFEILLILFIFIYTVLKLRIKYN